MKALKLLLLFLSYSLNAQQLSFALEQINGQAIIESGLTGKGIKVGIIDGGFLRANKSESLTHLFENNLIGGYKDYLDPEADDFAGSAAFDDVHGTEVWELIGGYHKKNNVRYGLATGATYYLARTDHGGYERRSEEQNAVEAMEWMAKEGVKVINVSLGYNFGFTNKKENYQPSQMDGKSTILTQEVDRISKEYGVLFIVSAGNDGSNRWKIVGSPGDAQRALTVGATKFKIWDHMKYSSLGPEWLDYVKPEISCYASTGTSFSAPIITGLAACLLEKNPDLSGNELKQLLIDACGLSNPNNYIGYGVPNAEHALNLLDGNSTPEKRIISTSKKSTTVELEQASTYVAVYHKQGWKVLKKETLRTSAPMVKVKKAKDCDSSTVLWQGGSLEILWK